MTDIKTRFTNLIMNGTNVEKSILCQLMTMDDFLKASQIINKDYFSNSQDSEIYEAIENVFKKYNKVDLLLVKNELQKNKSNISLKYLMGIYGSFIGGINIEIYCNILKEKYQRKELSNLGKSLSLDLQDKTSDVFDLQKRYTDEVTKLFTNTTEKKETFGDYINSLQEYLENDTPVGILTGIDIFDNAGGLKFGDLILIAGRPGNGKTALALQILKNISNNHRTHIDSLEMSQLSNIIRLVGNEMGISILDILKKQVDISDLLKMTKNLKNLQLTIDDNVNHYQANTCLVEIENKIIIHKLEVYVLDHIHQITTNREEIENLSRGLKNIAKRNKCVVICVCQLTRDPQNPIPKLMELRNSGSLESDADEVYMVYNRAKYVETHNLATIFNSGEDVYTHLAIMRAKGRNTGEDLRIVKFDRHFQRIENANKKMDTIEDLF